jgi:hypothetical protein
MSRALKIIGLLALISAVFSVAVLAVVFTLGAGPVHARDKITKSLTFAMPACPIEATTVPPTKTEFTLPKKKRRDLAVSVAGTVQVTDQTSSTVLLIEGAAEADLTGVSFSRTVKTLQHATGSVAFDRGCTRTDPYGSNNCTWTWGDSITASYQGALQEDITAGKLIVDLKIDNTVPLQFSCPVCGADCTITIPEQLDRDSWDEIWHLMIRLIRFPRFLTHCRSLTELVFAAGQRPRIRALPKRAGYRPLATRPVSQVS